MYNCVAEKKASFDGGAHQPLPYVVKVRVTSSEDSAPQVREFRMFAYSAYEALLQAMFEAGGQSIDDVKVKLEEIRPDLPAYLEMLLLRG